MQPVVPVGLTVEDQRGGLPSGSDMHCPTATATAQPAGGATCASSPRLVVDQGPQAVGSFVVPPGKTGYPRTTDAAPP